MANKKFVESTVKMNVRNILAITQYAIDCHIDCQNYKPNRTNDSTQEKLYSAILNSLLDIQMNVISLKYCLEELNNEKSN